MGPNFKAYYNNLNSGTPDLVYCNFAALHLAIQITPGNRLSSSDHIPLHIKINTNPITIPIETRFNFNKVNWKCFTVD